MIISLCVALPEGPHSFCNCCRKTSQPRASLACQDSVDGPATVSETTTRGKVNAYNTTAPGTHATHEIWCVHIDFVTAIIAVLVVKYDSPYVKGLPIKVTVQELNEAGEMETREMLGSYEDAYTAELQELFECLRNGKEIKTTARDAMEELRLYDMMYARWNKDRA